VQTETALQLWQDGARRLRDAAPRDRAQLERTADAVYDELRRRLGGAFTTEDLARLYGQDGDWVLDVAMKLAPDNPNAWDAQTIAGVAYSRYVREAIDWSGGKHRSQRELAEQQLPLDRP
jgi:hypothetical protein